MSVAERFEVTGIVQGVGFRPFVYRLATQLGLRGTVANVADGVSITVIGAPEMIETFAHRLIEEAPPLASVDEVRRRTVPAGPTSGFSILESGGSSRGRALVPPDVAMCTDCAIELRDPTNRRYRHPFITCTNCGPRYTIIQSLPYDRASTTMASFEMCPTCRAEYANPADRRYHAQPVSCHDCGPTLSFCRTGQSAVNGADAVSKTNQALRQGLVVAIKGIGGFHLVCDATDSAAVTAMRQRKHRLEKPFAVMASDLAHAETLGCIDELEADQLTSPARPIVLLRARPRNGLVDEVALGSPLLGVMLPYAPVQHLLFEGVDGPLVMTSANHQGEPIIHRNDADQLESLCDARLTHDRLIHVPCDDSVVRVAAGRILPIRRARGFAPVPVRFAEAPRDVLAVGGDMKSTFCLSSKSHAWIGPHLGDLQNLETRRRFEEMVDQLAALYSIEPEMVAADTHPRYWSASWARKRYGQKVQLIQHHHAHIASVMAEHQLDPGVRVLGFAFDGTGHGPDGSVWGGEALLADGRGFERVGHLASVSMPGGDAAIRNPYRAALAHLWAAGIDWTDDLAPVRRADATERGLLERQLRTGFGCTPTTSMGRLFDAVASLLDLRHTIGYEAQAAIDLEMVALDGVVDGPRYEFEVGAMDGGSSTRPLAAAERIVQPAAVLAAIVADLQRGRSVSDIARSFHLAVAEVVARLAATSREAGGPNDVVLSGGAFQNALLVTDCISTLTLAGFRVLTHSTVPPNDGGLSLGQAYIAAHRDLAAESRETHTREE